MIPADELFDAETDEDATAGSGDRRSPGPAVHRRRAACTWTPSRRPSRPSSPGAPIVVVDDEDRENEGDLIFAAGAATADLVGFMIRHTSGYICVAMTGADLDRLGLPPMTAVNEDRKGTAYAVSVDARDVESTGISAADRARTIKVLSDSATEPWELTRPGHVMPLRAVPGGVLRRAGHTEAAVDLARMAGLAAVGRPVRARQRRRHDDARSRSAGRSPTSTASS